MIRAQVALVVAAWAGTTMMLGQLGWFRRPRLADRIRPYCPTTAGRVSPPGLFSVTSLGEVFGPLGHGLSNRLSRVFGVSDELAARLARAHSPLGVSAFRSRQLGMGVVALGIAATASLVLGPPPGVALLGVLGLPLLTFLVLEQGALARSQAWQRRIFLELPVVAEQLAMLIGAGYSIGGALNRVSRRGTGACATDIAQVCNRTRQGLSDAAALREWATSADVDALTRLVNVLALHREGGNLAMLISDEARTIRRDVHRELVETIERRGQQVWIPVTVATLVPGVLFMAVPFIDAMRLFTST